DSGVLFIVEEARNDAALRSTELLTRRSGDGAGGKKWQRCPFPPMSNTMVFLLLFISLSQSPLL
ncbi:unnamed protein product, partial [Hymenolepis diminuta]